MADTRAPVASGPEVRRAGDIHVVVIGGGGTGAAITHDLIQRGFRVSLFERGELTSGTTGRHHGQLHSGARYAVGDVDIARECIEEVRILQRIAGESIEMNYGLFLALDDEDEAFAETFESACSAAGISNRRISIDEALRYEPKINPAARFAVVVPDGTLDAYRLPMQFFATAVSGTGADHGPAGYSSPGGAVVRPFTEVVAVDSRRGNVAGVRVRDLGAAARASGGGEEFIGADIVINAGGPWAGRIAGLGGMDLPITPAPGTLVAVKGRLTNMVISRLHPPGDADIIVPQRQLSIVGTTQWEIEDADSVTTPEEDVDRLLSQGDLLVPSFSSKAFHAAWTAVRPLAGRAVSNGADASGRRLSRDFEAVSHADEGARGFYSIIGGKATVLRAMGEKVADVVCDEVGLTIPCRTAETPLLSHRDYFRRKR
ncbi:MAG: FAD-dependent oxidoreductase [Spirochaetaceae bacterium]